MGNSCDNGWRCPFVGLDRMFGDFLRQKETSIPNDLTRMVSLRQSQTRRRIESDSIFEHTHYSKSKGINKSLLLRTTSVSGVGGGGGKEGGCILGPVGNRKTACYLYEQKLDNKKILRTAIEE